jgi:Ca2+-binding RTX toxin-like protein
VANPGIIVRTTSGNNTTSETGTTASYSFVLKTAPTDRVTITFTLSDGSEGSLSSNTLIFTPGNWNTAQTLTVTGLDDYENDGDIPYVISAVVSSDDPNYGRRRDGTGGVSISNIELVNEDDGLEKDLTIYGDSNAPNYNDLLSGKNGSDRLYGDRGRDRLYGGRGGDRLYGGVDDDTLWGEDGDDDLYGNEDDDTLYGGNGNDRLTGGEGYDLLTGGIGNDTYVIDDEFDVIDDQGLESDQDKVIIRGNITAYTLPQGIEGATLDGTVAKNLIGNAGNNELIGNANNNLLDGGEGSDYLYSASGDDSVFGGGGDDQIVGGDGKGDDAYDGGEGEDTVIYKSSERNPIEVNLRSGFAKGAEIGSDTLKDIEHIVAGQQDDLITGDARDNKIDGLAGRDTAVFQGFRSEYLVSRNSAGKLVVQDKLGGRDGSDTLDNIELFKFADDTYNADEVLKGSKDALLGEGEHRGQGKGSRITTQVNQADRITLAPVSFKSTSPDIITGFLPAEDKIVLPKAVFAKLKNTNMTTISSKKQLKKSKSGLNSTQLVYNKMTGEVIYDENGKKKGLGAGGVFARFEDATLPNLTATNFELG